MKEEQIKITEEQLERTAEAYADSVAHEYKDFIWELVKNAYIMGSKDRERGFFME